MAFTVIDRREFLQRMRGVSTAASSCVTHRFELESDNSWRVDDASAICEAFGCLSQSLNVHFRLTGIFAGRRRSSRRTSQHMMPL